MYGNSSSPFRSFRPDDDETAMTVCSTRSQPTRARPKAHVHGRVLVPEDVEAVVMDPSFDDEPTLAAVEGLGIPLERHPGYSVAVADLREHPEYRGAETLAVAERIAEDGQLTPAVIGRARQRRLADPQTLKRVWHCLARFGRGDNTQAG